MIDDHYESWKELNDGLYAYLSELSKMDKSDMLTVEEVHERIGSIIEGTASQKH